MVSVTQRYLVAAFSMLILVQPVSAANAQSNEGGCRLEREAGSNRRILRCERGLTIIAEPGARFDLVDRNGDGKADGVNLRRRAILVDAPRPAVAGGFQVVTPQAIAAVRQAIERRTPPAGLSGLQDVQILAVALDPAYQGDRVAAFVYGMADTMIAAHGGKTRFYAADILDGGRVYNAARNIEAAAWLLASRRDAHGRPLLLANEMSPDAVNLSFEREFGAIIGRLDLIANLLGENSRRIGINYAQGLMFFTFLPVR